MPDGSRNPDQRRDLSKPQRIFVPLEHKSAEETADAWIIRGTATTPRIDRMGDIVRPLGAQFDRARMPKLMLYHDSTRPVGTLTEINVKSTGITFAARIPKVLEPGVVRDRIEEAVHSVKYDLVSYTSIGFNPLESEPLDKEDPMSAFFGPFDFKKWEWLELSLVTIPAQPDAVITGIKSIDDALHSARRKSLAAAAPGRKPAERPPSPGASGTSQPPNGGFFSSQGKGNKMTSIEQHLTTLRESRQTKATRIQELDGVRLTRGEDAAFTDEERTELRGLSAEVQNLDDQIAVKQATVVEMRSARPLDPAVASRGAPYGFVRKADPDDKFKGQSETRRIIARALSHISMKSGDFKSAAQIAEERYGRTHPNLIAVMKSGVTGGGSGSGETWAELVAMDGRFTGDFVEFLYSRTVYDQLGLRDVPANVTIKGQDAAATGYFVGESKGIPASAASGSTVNLTPLKVGAISVCSNELLADSTPAAEMLVRDSLVQAASQKIDTVFLSASAVSAGVSPAGILNGLSAGGSAGNTPAHVMADIQALLANFISGKYANELVIVTTPTNAAALGMMVNSLGFPAFPNSQITQKGGTFQGYRVVTGHNVTANYIMMLSPMDIWKIGDSGIQVSVSQEAMIEQDTAPQGATDTPVAASATLTSMFQEESTAFKIVRRINWKLRRSDAVAYISDASYSLGS